MMPWRISWLGRAVVAVVVVVHIGLASLLAATPRREGTLGRMKLSPIARALQE